MAHTQLPLIHLAKMSSHYALCSAATSVATSTANESPETLATRNARRMRILPRYDPIVIFSFSLPSHCYSLLAVASEVWRFSNSPLRNEMRLIHEQVCVNQVSSLE